METTRNTTTYDLGDDWEMTLVCEPGKLPVMRLDWMGEEGRWEMEIPPDMPEDEQITQARMLAMVYTRGYDQGAVDERQTIIQVITQGCDAE